MKTTLILTLALILAALATREGHAQGLAVDLQCWSGSTESTPLARLTFDEVVKPFGCKVLISNNTGTNLTGVDFELTFGEHPLAPLSPNPLMGNYDVAGYFNCPTQPPTGNSFRPNMVLDVLANFPGFPTGTVQTGSTYPYGTRCHDYNLTPRATWRRDIAAGATATLRVEFKTGYIVAGSNFTTALRLKVTGQGFPAVADRTVPVDVSLATYPLEVIFNSAPIQSPAFAMAGTLNVGTGLYTLRGANTNTRYDLYLPYLRNGANGPEVVADGAYDPGAGHKLLFDPADLQLNAGYSDYFTRFAARFRDAGTGEDTTLAGALQFPFERVKDNHYRLSLGHLSGNNANLGTRVVTTSWAADYSQDAAVQTFLAGKTTMMTGRLCARSDQSAEVCGQTSANLYTAELLATRLMESITYHNVNNIAQNETSAVTPFTVMGLWVLPPYVPWRDSEVELVAQIPTNSLGQRGLPYHLRNTSLLAPMNNLGFISSGPTDTGDEEALLNRTIPTTAPNAWTSVGLFAAGLAIPDTTNEVRTQCEPSRYGVRNFGSRDECRVVIDWRVPRDVRASIDGSTYNATDMRRAALGSTGTIAITQDGEPRLFAKRSYNMEVDGGSRYSLSFLRDTMPRDLVLQRWSGIQDRTTNQYASVGCAFANVGLDNVRAPLTLTVEWPIGYEPTPSGASFASAFRVVYGDQTLATQNQNWGSAPGYPVPADRYTVAVDRAARRATVTFVGPRPDGSFPGSDQVSAPIDYTDARWVAVRVDGEHVPGVAREPSWTCKMMISESRAPDGALVLGSERVLSDAPFRILGPPAPVITGSSTPARVPAFGTATATVVVTNSAYDAAGLRLPNGAALSAREAALYYRVPRAGDAPEVENGAIVSSFVSAESLESADVWVSTLDTPSRGRTGLLEAGAVGWTLCSEAGETCDLAALAALGVLPGDVRWVAFALDELAVTDAEPRGVRPVSGVARVENPYRFEVTIADRGSDDEATMRPRAELHSADTLELGPEPDRFDVVVFTGCDARVIGTPCVAGVGACVTEGVFRCVGETTSCSAEDDLPTSMGEETCDGIDNDCDGLVDAADPTLEERLCEKQVGVCLGATAPAERCVMTNDGAAWEPCEALDYAAWAFTSTASNGQPGSYSEAEAIGCDGLDNDCDGRTDEGFVGTATSCGTSICRVETTTQCVDGEVVDLCTPLSPPPGTVELCDAIDNDCDGQIDEANACPEVDTVIVQCPQSPTAATTHRFDYYEPVIDAQRFECQLDGGPWFPCDGGSWTAMELGLGAHTLLVRAIGPLDRRDPTPAFCAWLVDNTVPDTFVTVAPSNPSQLGDGVFGFATNVENPNDYYCVIAPGPRPATPPPYPYPSCGVTHTFAGLADGLYTIHVYVESRTGVLDPSPATHTWRVDTTSPETVLDSLPEAVVCATDISFTFGAVTDSVEAAATFECRLDESAWATCSSPYSLSDLDSGQHVFEVRAIDPTGNVDPTPARVVFEIELAAPVATLGLTPTDPSQSGDATFTFTSDLEATFECALNQVGEVAPAFAPCTSPKHYAELADGTWALQVRARGACGAGATVTHTWVVDSTWPETAFLTTPPVQVGRSHEAVFTHHDPTDPDTDTFECSLDGAAWFACDGGELGLEPLPLGSHQLAVRTCALFGRPTNPVRRCDPTPATFTWVVTESECPLDTTPPTLSCPATRTVECVAGGGVVAIDPPSAEDPCGVELEVAESASYPLGQTPVVVTATDGGGNVATCIAVVEVVDTTPPTLTCGADLQVDNDPGVCGATVQITPPEVSDACHGERLTVVSDAPASFPVGTTEVTWRVIDPTGLAATCIQRVTVVDAEALTMVCEPTLRREAPADQCGWSGSVEAAVSDNCALDASILEEQNLFAVGETVVSFAARDGEREVTCDTTLTVVDVTPPTVRCGELQRDGFPRVAVAEDACGATLSYEDLRCESEGGCPVAIDNQGGGLVLTGPLTRPTRATWVVRATDPSGNSATVTCSADLLGDPDFDGLTDNDNCPDETNPGQEDLDGDGLGDACDFELEGIRASGGGCGAGHGGLVGLLMGLFALLFKSFSARRRAPSRG